jgi:hypothetical protein
MQGPTSRVTDRLRIPRHVLRQGSAHPFTGPGSPLVGDCLLESADDSFRVRLKVIQWRQVVLEPAVGSAQPEEEVVGTPAFAARDSEDIPDGGILTVKVELECREHGLVHPADRERVRLRGGIR